MFFSFVPFLLSFWFVRSIKYILFWVYLWQLKQYHIGRFLAHFKTENGKTLIRQPLQIFKTFLFIIASICALFFQGNYLLILPPLLFLIYFLESLLYFRKIFSGKTKHPKLTKKTGFLILISLLVFITFPLLVWTITKDIFWFTLIVLALDILLPVVVSIVVLIFQPIADHYRLSLQKKAKEKLKNFKNLTIIAITGSYGKTSTKEYLTAILSSKFKVLSTKEHQNTELGIPLCILNELKPEHEIFIVEMGAYDKGTIKRICDFVKPEIGIVTGVNAQHLSLFGSIDNLLSAEGGWELLQSLPIDGLLVVNGENEYCMELYRKADVKKIAYRLDEKLSSFVKTSDGQVKNIDIRKNFASFSIDDIDFKVDVLGRHNVLNLLGAILVSKELGMSLKEIEKASERITEKNSSFKVAKNKDGVFVINSTYSSNPDGVVADLEYLKLYSGNPPSPTGFGRARKIIVMPCLIELGDKAKEVHQKIGKKISEVCDLAIITTKEYYVEMKSPRAHLIERPQEIVAKIKEFTQAGDAVLLEGRLPKEIIDLLK
ncbi:UDP-N-acetylmuramoyl-tripeptide--D-alanyl-D-alanine ligase [Patescibacteria group bacterium]|nr:UDP-N-acetylmuramoyl-tripeptide--D-alanyl-D-alanine ligase [Patescibacteria group bacterium]